MSLFPLFWIAKPLKTKYFSAIYSKRIYAVTLKSLYATTLLNMTIPLEHNQTTQHETLSCVDAVVFGQNITRLRKQAKITKQKFALMVGVGRPFLNRIENGTADPRLSVVRCFAEALESTPQELITPYVQSTESSQTEPRGHAKLL